MQQKGERCCFTWIEYLCNLNLSLLHQLSDIVKEVGGGGLSCSSKRERERERERERDKFGFLMAENQFRWGSRSWWSRRQRKGRQKLPKEAANRRETVRKAKMD